MAGASGAVFTFVSEKCLLLKKGLRNATQSQTFLCAFPSWPFGYEFPSLVLNAALSG